MTPEQQGELNCHLGRFYRDEITARPIREYVDRLIAEAVAVETKRCAKICEDMRPTGGRAWTDEQSACWDALTDAAMNINAKD